MAAEKKIPFEFVIEALEGLHPRVRPMFGCYAIYVGEKMMLILRQRKDFLQDNGVWVATAREHHDSLRKIFPSLRTIELFGKKETQWQVLPVMADDFEESVLKVCELVRKRDPRIGKVPRARSGKRKEK